MSVNRFLLFLPFPTYFLLSFQMTEKEKRTKLGQENIQILTKMKLGSDKIYKKKLIEWKIFEFSMIFVRQQLHI